MNDVDFMQLALEEARLAEVAGEVPIGAVLVSGEVILARGSNRTIRDCDPTAHAEIVALREAARVHGAFSLNGTTFYVTLEPCAMCAGAMLQAGVARLVYGADDPKGGAVRTCFNMFASPHSNHPIAVLPGTLCDESASLLRAFFASRRRSKTAGT